jgi:hypothetical protein
MGLLLFWNYSLTLLTRRAEFDPIIYPLYNANAEFLVPVVTCCHVFNAALGHDLVVLTALEIGLCYVRIIRGRVLRRVGMPVYAFI